jgi:hypothetical protein
MAPEKIVEEYPHFIHIKRFKNKSDISIEQIREVIDKLKLKVPGSQAVKRIIFIEDAQFLSIPAQNSLLKNLEEPSRETVFILSVNFSQSLLPTIISRTQRLEVQPVGLNEATSYWKNEFEVRLIESAWKLSGGAAGLMYALLSEDEAHPLKSSVEDAKNFIKASRYQRLLLADRLSQRREQFLLFLDAMARTLSFLQQAAVKNGRKAQSDNILTSRKVIKESYIAIEQNANTKLVALKMVMDLKV